MINHDILIPEMDNVIWVDGIPQRVLLDGKINESVQLIRWDKASQSGYIQLRNGEEYDFTDEGVMTQFVSAWQREADVDQEKDNSEAFAQRNADNAFDVSAVVDPPRAEKAQQVADKVAAAEARHAAWRDALEAKRATRRQALAAKNAARIAAKRQREPRELPGETP